MRYNHIAPPGTFIHNYMTYMEKQETAWVYDFWSAMWLLSLACGRHIVVDRPRAPVYLNMYAVFIAESGITRKSTAVRHVTNVARALMASHPHIGLVQNKATASHIDLVLHERTLDHGCGQLAICASELAAFMDTSSSSNALATLLTDLYDCPASRQGGGSASRGTTTQRNVWMSFLSASTPSWLFKSISPNIIEGGFTSRCYFIVSESPKARIAWPDETVDSYEPFVDHLKRVRATASTYNTITINTNALNAFRAWYARRATHIDPFRATFESREDGHILRIAALLCINDESWIIQKQHIAAAIRIVNELKTNAHILFAGSNARSNWILGIETVRDTLMTNGSDYMPRSRLYMRCRGHLDVMEFTALLDALEQSGYIERIHMQHEGAGRPTELIRGTKLINARNLASQFAVNY